MDNFRDSYFQVDWDLTTKRLKGTYWGKQYDTGRGFAVTVINGGQVVTATNEVLRLKWEKPDNTTGYVNATIVNGKFIVENIDQMFTVHGSVRADFELSVAGEFVASITFYVNVEKAVAVDAIESSSDFTALQDALADVGDMQAQVDAVIANATVDSEVILARGTEATLGARLDASDAQLAEIVTDTKTEFNNIVTNGDFSSGTTGYTRSNNALVNWSVNDKVLTYQTASTSHSVKRIFELEVGNKYYMTYMMKINNSDESLSVLSKLTGTSVLLNKFVYNTIPQSWVRVSDVFIADNSTAVMEWRGTKILNDFDVDVQLKEIILTKISNEKTKEQMDKLIEIIPEKWFIGQLRNTTLLDSVLIKQISASDKITDLQYYKNNNFIDKKLEWTLGTISSTTGFLAESNTRIRSNVITVPKGSLMIYSGDEAKNYLIMKYNANGTITSIGFRSNDSYEFDEDCEVAFLMRYSDSRVITNRNDLSDTIKLMTKSVPMQDVDRIRMIDGDYFYWSDFTFVGNELWCFRPSDYTNISEGVGAIYIFDELFNFKKRLLHDFGHCNTIEYNANSDSLIFGNGTGSYNTDGYIYIIKGVNHWNTLDEDTMLNLTGIEGSKITVIPVYRDFGDKVNVCWGEDKNNLANIAYVMSNNNANITKILLGKGSLQLEEGVLEVVASDEYNGTYRIIGEYTMESTGVNQGSTYYNGFLWLAVDHDGLKISKVEMKPDGTTSVVTKHETAFNASGIEFSWASEGVTVRNGVLYHTTLGGLRAIHRYRPF